MATFNLQKISIGLLLSSLFYFSHANAAQSTGEEMDSLSNPARSSTFFDQVEMDALSTQLRNIDREGSGWSVWASEFKGEGNAANSSSLIHGFDQEYSGFLAGIDKKIHSSENKEIYVGGFVGYSKSSMSTSFHYFTNLYESRIDEDLKAYSVGTYVKYRQPKNDFYITAAFKGTQAVENHNLDIYMTTNIQTKEDKSFNWIATVETGRRFYTNTTNKKGFYIEPQAQLTVGQIGDFQYNSFIREHHYLQMDIPTQNILTGRLGAVVGYDIKEGKNPIHLYAKASYSREMGDAPTMNLTNYPAKKYYENISGDFDTDWFTYGVGVKAELNKKHQLLLDLETGSGGDVEKKWQITGSYRYSW